MGIDSFTQYLRVSLPCDSWLLLNCRRSRPTVQVRVSDDALPCFFCSNPYPAGSQIGSPASSWPEYTEQGPMVLDINTNLTVNQHLRPRHCALWTDLMPQLNTSCSTSRSPSTVPSCPSPSPQASKDTEEWKYLSIGLITLIVILAVVVAFLLVERRSKGRQIEYRNSIPKSLVQFQFSIVTLYFIACRQSTSLLLY